MRSVRYAKQGTEYKYGKCDPSCAAVHEVGRAWLFPSPLLFFFGAENLGGKEPRGHCRPGKKKVGESYITRVRRKISTKSRKKATKARELN